MASLVARTARALSGRSAAVMRPCSAAVRAFSAKKDAGLSTDDITKYFIDLDAQAGAKKASEIPIKLSGRSGELTAELYSAAQKTKSFDKVVKELESFVAAVQAGGLVVDRFFSSSNYSAEECDKVLALLTTSAEPLSSFASIKDVEVKEVIVDNEGNLATWQNARKAVAAIGLSEPVKALLATLASEGRLDLVKKVATKSAELRAVTSKTTDVVVTSAIPLSKAQQEAVSKALPKYVPSGQAVNVSYATDASILGGLLVTFGNSTIDLSVTSKLVEAAAEKSA